MIDQDGPFVRAGFQGFRPLQRKGSCDGDACYELAWRKIVSKCAAHLVSDTAR